MMLDGIADSLATIKNFVERKREARRWRRLREMGMHIGKDVLFSAPTFIDISHCYLISIGDRCRFGPNCSILSHDALANEFIDAGKIAKVVIRESCSFGMGAIILPGVEIGPRAIIGAGSVVSSNIPPDCVVAGNPARIICSLKEYIRYHKISLKRFPNFPHTEYGMETLAPEKVKKMLEQMDGGVGYITGGYSHRFGPKSNSTS
jgi:maltose O-acetyltransferase